MLYISLQQLLVLLVNFSQSLQTDKDLQASTRFVTAECRAERLSKSPNRRGGKIHNVSLILIVRKPYIEETVAQSQTWL